MEIKTLISFEWVKQIFSAEWDIVGVLFCSNGEV